MAEKAKKNGKIARQDQLPTMENAAISEIENAALDYAEGRDERMEATEKEVELKSVLIALMHKHDRTEYKRGRISVTLLVEKEKVKVRIKDEDIAVEVKSDKKDEAIQ